MLFHALEIPRGIRAHPIFQCAIFMWRFFKSRVFVGEPRTLGELKIAIREKIQEIEEVT